MSEKQLIVSGVDLMETNICPFCMDEIKEDAIICSLCGESLAKHENSSEIIKSDALHLNYSNHERIIYQLCKSMLNKSCTL